MLRGKTKFSVFNPIMGKDTVEHELPQIVYPRTLCRR